MPCPRFVTQRSIAKRVASIVADRVHSNRIEPPSKRMELNSGSQKESSQSIENIDQRDSQRQTETPQSASNSHSLVIPQVSTETLRGTLLGKYRTNPIPLPSCHNAQTGDHEPLSASKIDPSISNHSLIASNQYIVPLPPKPNTPPIEKPAIPPPVNLVEVIQKLLKISEPLQEPKFRFETSQEAASYNFELLQCHKFDLESLLHSNDGTRSVTTYGSEFKTTPQLERLLHKHPRWKKLKQLLEKVSGWELEPVPEHLRESAVIRGNHKSADSNTKFLESALTKEVLKGWELILPIGKATEIPNLVISPMGAHAIQATGSPEIE